MEDTLAETRVEEKPLKDLLHELSEDSTRLLQQESELFRREMQGHLDQVKRQVGVLGAGVFVAYVGFLALTTSVIVALDIVLPGWAGALIVGGSYTIVGGIMLLAGRERLAQEQLGPDQTIDSVKNDVRAVREAMR